MIDNHERTIRWKTLDREDLTPDEAEDLDQAIRARAEANAGETHFLVGAALRMRDGNVFSGWNDENKVQKGLHAEESGRASIPKSSRAYGLQRITVVGGFEEKLSTRTTPPCGHCLQINSELVQSGTEVDIIAAGVAGKILKTTLRDMLPFGFDLTDFLAEDPPDGTFD